MLPLVFNSKLQKCIFCRSDQTRGWFWSAGGEGEGWMMCVLHNMSMMTVAVVVVVIVAAVHVVDFNLQFWQNMHCIWWLARLKLLLFYAGPKGRSCKVFTSGTHTHTRIHEPVLSSLSKNNWHLPMAGGKYGRLFIFTLLLQNKNSHTHTHRQTHKYTTTPTDLEDQKKPMQTWDKLTQCKVFWGGEQLGSRD